MTEVTRPDHVDDDGDDQLLRLQLDHMVEEAGKDSFPASDPPSWWTGRREPAPSTRPTGGER